MSAATTAQAPILPHQQAAACETPRATLSEAAGTRAELFAEFIRGLNAAGIPYCLLSGYDSDALTNDSDVDFMVRPEDGARIMPLLRDTASRCGALLVQAIQHESEACYYVLAKQTGPEVAYLHPDCTTDYRREGRLWLAADEVIRNRRQRKGSFVPAVADEFQYYLIKKILKQEITCRNVRRIAALYVSHPEECCERLRRFWTQRTTRALVSAIVTGDIEWLELHRSDLLAELLGSAPLESRVRRSIQRLREWRRRVNRIIHPTGLSIRVGKGGATQRSEFATQLEYNLRPAFRRTKIIAEAQSNKLGASISTLVAKARSTLIIRSAPESARRWWTPREISFDLPDLGQPAVEWATRIVLEAMGRRLEWRSS